MSSVLRNAAEASEGTKKEHLPSKLQYMLKNKSELLTRIGVTLGDTGLTLAMGIAKPNYSMAIRYLHGVMEKAKRFEKEDFDDICLSVIEQQPVTYQAFVKACNKAEIEGKVKKTSTQKPKVARSNATRIKDLRGADYFKYEKDGL